MTPDPSYLAERLAQSVAETVSQRLCRPTATYRVQFAKGTFAFRDAADVAPYLVDLGISHLYASPYLKTPAGSTNGYAIADYTQLDPELGGDPDYRVMVDCLRRHSLGQILDTVPNHMSATAGENPWWTDVLENGPASPYAAYFDIDWHPVKEELRNQILLPILGDQYGQALESGSIVLEFREGAFCIRYGGIVLPLEPRTYRVILTHRLDTLTADELVAPEDLRELESIITALEHLPDRTAVEPASVAERRREKEVIKSRLRAIAGRAPPVAEFLHRNVEEFNGTPGDPRSCDLLDKLLAAQVYRLSHWKAAADEINYRRFFDINELAAVCMERPEVFAESHRLVFELLLRGDVAGLRIDHIDGLYDPREYLRQLHRAYLLALGKEHYDRALESNQPDDEKPPTWESVHRNFLARATALTCADRTALPLYVVVEKILGADETLPDDWLVAGTTGYEFLSKLGGLFVDPAGLAELTTLYNRFIDQRLDFRAVAWQSKLLICHVAMASDLQLLARRLNRISERHRRSRDFTLNSLRVALREILSCFPVYRTYIDGDHVSQRDRDVVARAVAQAKRRNPATDVAVYDFIRDVLLLEGPPDLDETGRRERELFVGRFQQVTSPITAKAIEDTAFYRYVPLLSLNEVGGDPAHGPTSIEEFHRHNLAWQSSWPRSLVATTTHDTKRSEDTRARISVLSEIPGLWRKAVNRWARLNRRHHREVDGQPAPSRNDEYLFYQSLVGVWPLEPPHGETMTQLAGRLAAYMEKATHEAKIHTSWINPDPEYDAAVRSFVTTVLNDHAKNRFLAEFRVFHEQVVNWGLYGALSQTLLKLTAPGVPDIYQGQELWDFSLVDPDNRRPVDYATRRDLLAQLRDETGRGGESLSALARQLARDPRDPRLKLLVTWRVLQLRRQQADLFADGDYLPLATQGTKATHLCAFARRAASSTSEPTVAVVVAPRLIARLTPLEPGPPSPPPPLGPAVWEDTQLLTGDIGPVPLTDVFTGRAFSPHDDRLPAADVLADFPLALLTNAPLP